MLFIDASKEFLQGKNQNQIREDVEVAKIVKTCQERKSKDKYAYVATREEIRENDYNLNIPRYVNTFEEEEDVDIAAVQKRIEHLELELAEVRVEIVSCLKELGL